MLRIGLAVLLAATAASAQVVLSGRVVDEHNAPLAGAQVAVRRPGGRPREASADAAGLFRILLPAPGEYRVSVDHQGYFRLQDRPVEVSESGARITLVLNPQREVFQSIQVGASPSPVDIAQTQHEQRLSGTEVNDIPYPASHSLRSGMKLMPGVIQDPSGGVHFHGGAEYQTQYTLDGFDISDPITGRYSTRVAVEGVRSVGLTSGRESPQFGRGSAGTLDIRTEDGTDRFHYTATNFVPGVDTHNGFHLGHWTPRAAFTGPILKNRAWFSDSIDGEYNQGYVSGLSKGQDTNSLWAAGNLFHTQVNLTPSNILYTDVLANYSHQAHYGLGVLDPISTTTALGSNQWLAAVKEMHTWRGGMLLESGFAWQRGFERRTPLGPAPYVLSPEGRSGNYFVDSRERGRREQFFANLFPPAFHAAGRHQLQFGADVQRLSYAALFRRTEYEVIGLSGLPLFKTGFTGSGNFEQTDAALAWYVNDHWQPAGRLTIDAGLRQDWNRLIGQAAVAPRVSLAYAPFSNARTKVTGGYALLHDAVPMALLSRPLDQQSVTTPYGGAPLVTTFVMGRDLRLPNYGQWSAGLEQDLGHHIGARAEWLRKRGRDGFVYTSSSPGVGPITVQPLALGYGFGGTYTLSNLRRDAYDEFAITLRQSLGDQYVWLASYVRSRAVSNAVLDPSVDQPLQVANNFGPMPWDAPNRLLSWGYLPLYGKNWAIAYLLDWRSGFPFSITEDTGRVVGNVNARRFPSNFDLNLHIERRFNFEGYRLGLRVGCNNVTDHRNPTAVSNVAGAPDFLQFYGDEGRHLVLRIRVFGRAPR